MSTEIRVPAEEKPLKLLKSTTINTEAAKNISIVHLQGIIIEAATTIIINITMRSRGSHIREGAVNQGDMRSIIVQSIIFKVAEAEASRKAVVQEIDTPNIRRANTIS